MELKHMIVPFTKMEGDANSEEGFFEGYGSVYNNVDSHGDIIQGGAFTKSLEQFKKEGTLPSMYWMHDMAKPIGDWLEMSEDETGLKVRGRLWIRGDRKVENAVLAYNLMHGTGKKGLSIGYYARDYEMQEFNGGTVRLLKEIDLMEVSVVGWGSNPQALVTSVKSMTDEDGKILDKREVEKVLRDAGLSRRQAKAFIAGGFDAVACDEQKHDDAVEREAQLDEATNASLQKLLSILKG